MWATFGAYGLQSGNDWYTVECVSLHPEAAGWGVGPEAVGRVSVVAWLWVQVLDEKKRKDEATLRFVLLCSRSRQGWWPTAKMCYLVSR